MPELSIETAWTCSTNEYFTISVKSSDGSSTYNPTYGKLDPYQREKQMCEYGWHCTCIGFKTRGTCRHIKEAETKRCGWNVCCEPTNYPKKKGNNHVCPNCGGSVIGVRVGI